MVKDIDLRASKKKRHGYFIVARDPGRAREFFNEIESYCRTLTPYYDDPYDINQGIAVRCTVDPLMTPHITFRKVTEYTQTQTQSLDHVQVRVKYHDQTETSVSYKILDSSDHAQTLRIPWFAKNKISLRSVDTLTECSLVKDQALAKDKDLKIFFVYTS